MDWIHLIIINFRFQLNAQCFISLTMLLYIINKMYDQQHIKIWIHLFRDMEKLWDRVNTEIIDFHKMRQNFWAVEILVSQSGLSSLDYDFVVFSPTAINTSMSIDRVSK